MAQATQFVPATQAPLLDKDTIGQAVQLKKVPTPQPDLKYNAKLSPEVAQFVASRLQPLPQLDINSFRYMYDPPAKKRDALNSRMWNVGNRIRSHYNLPEFSKLTEVSQEERVYLVVVQSCSQVGLAVTCVVDGPWTSEVSYGANIGLQMDDIDSYSLYPGKIFAFKGKNMGSHKPDSVTNATVIVTKIYEAPPLPMAVTARQRVKMEEDAVSPTRMVILSGPYAMDQVRTIKQVEDLVRFAYQKRHASVVILAGPFVAAPIDGKVDDAMMYDDQFDAIAEKMNTLADEFHGLKLVVIPSIKDLAADFVFPQPAFDVDFGHKNILGLGNPTAFVINDDATVAICTNDILRHMATSGNYVEVQPDSALGKIPRVAAQVVRSHSYYPLVPPAPDAQVDFTHHESFEFLQCTPDILILPSYHAAFAEKVEGTLVVNPGIVNKRNFAEVTIASGPHSLPIADRTSVEIFKLV